MAFKKFIKIHHGRAGYSYPAVRLGTNGIYFNKRAVEQYKLEQYKSVQFFVDKEKKLLGFMPLHIPCADTFKINKSMITSGHKYIYKSFDFLQRFLMKNSPNECVFKIHEDSENKEIMFFIKIEGALKKGGDL